MDEILVQQGNNQHSMSAEIRTKPRRKILSKKIGKTYVKKLVNKCSCVLKNEHLFIC